MKISPMVLAERICANEVPDVKPAVKRKIAPYVAVVQALRKSAKEVCYTHITIKFLLIDLIVGPERRRPAPGVDRAHFL